MTLTPEEARERVADLATRIDEYAAQWKKAQAEILERLALLEKRLHWATVHELAWKLYTGQFAPCPDLSPETAARMAFDYAEAFVTEQHRREAADDDIDGIDKRLSAAAEAKAAKAAERLDAIARGEALR